LIVFISILMTVLWAGSSHLVALRLEGSGEFNTQFYAYSALVSSTHIASFLYAAPFVFFQQVSGFSILQFVNYLPVVYQIALSVVANKAVHNLTWKHASISSIPILLLVSARILLNVLMNSQMVADALLQ
jgi:hypothetical protein